MSGDFVEVGFLEGRLEHYALMEIDGRCEWWSRKKWEAWKKGEVKV